MSSSGGSSSDFIVVLGSENLEDGSLSPMAAARCEAALRLHFERPHAPIFLTGGTGDFNPTKFPHAFWLQRHLVSCGVQYDRMVTLSQCSNTVADLAEVARTLERMSDTRSLAPKADSDALIGIGSGPRVSIVTSDYHLPRAKLIASTILPPADLEFVPAPTRLGDKARTRQLFHHEGVRIIELIDQGGVVWDGCLHQFNGRTEQCFPGVDLRAEREQASAFDPSVFSARLSHVGSPAIPRAETIVPNYISPRESIRARATENGSPSRRRASGQTRAWETGSPFITPPVEGDSVFDNRQGERSRGDELRP